MSILYAVSTLYVGDYTKEILNQKYNYSWIHLQNLTDEMDSIQRQANIPFGLILNSFCNQNSTRYFKEKKDALKYGYCHPLDAKQKVLILDTPIVFTVEVERSKEQEGKITYPVKKILSVEVPTFQMTEKKLDLNPTEFLNLKDKELGLTEVYKDMGLNNATSKNPFVCNETNHFANPFNPLDNFATLFTKSQNFANGSALFPAKIIKDGLDKLNQSQNLSLKRKPFKG